MKVWIRFWLIPKLGDDGSNPQLEHISSISPSETKKLSLYYWREGNEEVDFVLEYKKRVIALDLKSSKTGKLSGMSAFTKQFQPEKSILIGEGGIPWQDFLEMDILDLYEK